MLDQRLFLTPARDSLQTFTQLFSSNAIPIARKIEDTWNTPGDHGARGKLAGSGETKRATVMRCGLSATRHKTDVAMRASANSILPTGDMERAGPPHAKGKAEASRHSPWLTHRAVSTSGMKLRVDIACQARFVLSQCSVCWKG
jgi:hypothetical protein